MMVLADQDVPHGTDSDSVVAEWSHSLEVSQDFCPSSPSQKITMVLAGGVEIRVVPMLYEYNFYDYTISSMIVEPFRSNTAQEVLSMT